MIKNRNELKKFYNSLTDKYQGYVQMSDSRIKDNHIFKIAQILPKWEDLHNEVNYILEMALYEPNSKPSNRSILIRQQNSEWLVIDRKLTQKEIENSDSFFTLIKDTPKMKIAQIWEEEKNEFCLDMEVLEPKYLLFAGFKHE